MSPCKGFQDKDQDLTSWYATESSIVLDNGSVENNPRIEREEDEKCINFSGQILLQHTV